MKPSACMELSHRLLVWTVLLIAALVTAGSAHADAVAVLPVTSTARSLQLYETATATALAAGLSANLGTRTKAVSSPSDVSADTRVIVDCRLVSVEADRVKLEASVRRASTGKSVARVATDALAITELDALVAELSRKLAAPIEHALKPIEPIRLPTAVVQGTRPVEGASASPSSAPGPDVLLVTPVGMAAKGVVSIEQPATAGALEMLSRMGLRSVRSDSHETLALVAELRASGARYALLIEVQQVRFSYKEVLSARGRVRILMLGVDGLPVFDKTVSTDTLVGGRGDRHQAIVYRVVEQALDMSLPEFRSLKDASSS